MILKSCKQSELDHKNSISKQTPGLHVALITSDEY